MNESGVTMVTRLEKLQQIEKETNGRVAFIPCPHIAADELSPRRFINLADTDEKTITLALCKQCETLLIGELLNSAIERLLDSKNSGQIAVFRGDSGVQGY